MTTNGNQHASRSRTGVRLTRRGRALVVLVAVGALLLSFWLGTWRASVATTEASERAPSYDTVVLRPGDTLWEIAERRDPDADPRIMVHRIMQLNDLPGAAVQAGQRIALPPPG